MEGGWVEVVRGAILAINSPTLVLHCEKFININEVIDVLVNLG
jgi:hypothetical protein